MSTRKFILFVLLAKITVAAAPAKSQEESGLRPKVGRDVVQVRAGQLTRNGKPWTPHGYYQIAFEVAPANLSRADHPFWANAYNHYTPTEYKEMRIAGADSVRLQIAQAAADPKSALYDESYVEKAMGAIQAARDQGLVVMVCVQDESHVPGEVAIDLPGPGTNRIWQALAPKFANDAGVMYELLNEPRPQPTPQNWQRWKRTMEQTITTIRNTGAPNVVIADGLAVGQVLDGAPPLKDSQVVYASHPYALAAHGETAAAWDDKFGRFARHAPVIITEWLSGGYFCDENTAASTIAFFKYLAEKHIGFEAGVWDWTSGGFGSARWGFPDSRSSTFVGLSCHQPGFGMGLSLDSWYSTGTVPSQPK